MDSEIKTVFFESMKQIYMKYIDTDVAPLEINIPSKMRKGISSVFLGDGTAKSVKEMMLLMEDAVQNIVQLMTEAAIRFSLENNSRSSISSRSRVQSDSAGTFCENPDF